VQLHRTLLHQCRIHWQEWVVLLVCTILADAECMQSQRHCILHSSAMSRTVQLFCMACGCWRQASRHPLFPPLSCQSPRPSAPATTWDTHDQVLQEGASTDQHSATLRSRWLQFVVGARRCFAVVSKGGECTCWLAGPSPLCSRQPRRLELYCGGESAAPICCVANAAHPPVRLEGGHGKHPRRRTW